MIWRNRSPSLYTMILVFISSGILVSSFHTHSNRDWNNSHASAHTDTHISESTVYCPVCALRLQTTPTVTPSYAVIQVVAIIENAPFESKKLDAFFGPLTGRSPPAIV